MLVVPVPCRVDESRQGHGGVKSPHVEGTDHLGLSQQVSGVNFGSHSRRRACRDVSKEVVKVVGTAEDDFPAAFDAWDSVIEKKDDVPVRRRIYILLNAGVQCVDVCMGRRLDVTAPCNVADGGDEESVAKVERQNAKRGNTIAGGRNVRVRGWS